MKKQTLIIASLFALVLLYVGGSYLYRNSTSTLDRDKQAALSRTDAFSFGSANANVTIVEFFDPACETCKAFYPFVKNIMKKHDGKIKLVMRYAPFHTDSFYVTQMIEAARYQNKYQEALEIIYQYQSQWSSHNKGADIGFIWSILPQAGIDVDRLKEDMKKQEVETAIKKDIADTKVLGVMATPEFFVNAKPLKKFGYKELETLIESEL